MKNVMFILLAAGALAACTAKSPAQPNSNMGMKPNTSMNKPTMPTPSKPMTTNPNNTPAAKFCAQKGGKSEVHSNADGSGYRVCVLKDGSIMDEQGYYNAHH